MPTEILSPPARVRGRCKVHHISPLTAAVTLALVRFHLVGGVMLERSHASPAIEPSAFTALDDDAGCPADPRPPQPSLPFD